MFGISTLTLMTFLSASLFALADVTPSDPGPGVIYKTGGTCHIAWNGDLASTTAWKNMTIQLMTGANLNMIALQTVATGLDGSKSGVFDHICPAVSPNAAIYFYQFTAPGTPDKQWTTRFTIASTTGATVPPSNPTQPSGDPIPWGTGALIGNSAINTTPTSSIPLNTAPPPSIPPSPSYLATTSAPAPPLGMITVIASSLPVATASANTTKTNTTVSANGNAAVGLVAVNSRIWTAAVALGISAMAFTVLL